MGKYNIWKRLKYCWWILRGKPHYVAIFWESKVAGPIGQSSVDNLTLNNIKLVSEDVDGRIRDTYEEALIEQTDSAVDEVKNIINGIE